MASLTPVSVFPGAPTTVRAQPVTLGSDAKGQRVAYPVGNFVVVRNFADPKAEYIVCTKHSVPVTCARISPRGDLVASGDRDGNLLIWVHRTDTRVLLQQKALGGIVKDVAWSEDGERLIAVGEGKTTFGVVISTDGGNSIGNINGHEKPIFSCDFRKQRPFRLATGSGDSTVGFFEGPPFKFKHTVSGHHTNNVTCVKFSPSGDLVASVSGKNTITLMDGKTGDFARTIPTTHTGTILGLCWSPDGSMVATCSADKTVKGYKSEDGQELFSTSLGNSIPFMQQGITYLFEGMLTCSYNGDLNVLNEKGKLTATHRGHTHPPSHLILLPSEQLLSISSDGKILLWNDEGVAMPFNAPLDFISGAGVSASGALAVVGGGTDLALLDFTQLKLTPLEKAATGVIAIAVISDNAFAVLHKASVVVYNADGKKICEEKITGDGGSRFDCCSLAVSPETSTIAVGGDKCVKTFQFTGSSLTPGVTFAGQHRGDVSALAFNREGTTIASGDTTRLIFVWDASSGNVLFDELVFHSSKITSLAFGASSHTLISGSVDSSIILWDLPAKKRITQANAHHGGVTAVAFHPTLPTVISAGVDCFIRQWAFEA